MDDATYHQDVVLPLLGYNCRRTDGLANSLSSARCDMRRWYVCKEVMNPASGGFLKPSIVLG
jgi:hypothetical protein